MAPPADEQRLLNALMGNLAWLARRIPHVVRGRERVLELGAGDGGLGAELARRCSTVTCGGIDLLPRPDAWPTQWDWWALDALDFQHFDRYPVVVGNLFFHLLSPDELAALGRTLRRSARVILTSEPARRRLHLWQIGFLRALGLGPAARRFARAGVRSGFVGDELPQALGLSPRDWSWQVTVEWRGAYRLLAWRHVPPPFRK